MTEVKICGLSEPETLEAAIAAGADFVGFAFFPKSPRNVSLDQAKKLAAQVSGRTRIVTFAVDAGDDLLSAINAAVDPDLFQAHGSETPQRIAEIKALTGKQVIKVIKVREVADVARARDFAGVADLILFDAKAPENLQDALPGGNGIAFDWSFLADARGRSRFMLSGGLTPENVAEAIRITGAPIVDVSSGVEKAPGIKDINLIRKFIEAAKAKG